MYGDIKKNFQKELEAIRNAGLHKEERVLTSRQGRLVNVNGREALNFCSNNYLGLAGSDEMVMAAKASLDVYGFGLSSVRFICGTQDVHKELESHTAAFVGTEDAALYTSCMAANTGFFATLFGEEDVIFSDGLNHASIIDGIRLSKAARYIYAHLDMNDLEKGLGEHQDKRMRCIVTDGVFSMDGDIAPLKEICDLADRYRALVVVDDSHATGFMGKTGRGTHEHAGVEGRVDAITSTYGKALGGAGGGFVAAHKEITDLLRQRSRTYLFSNSLPPVIAGAALFALQYVSERPDLREHLWDNTRYFREKMQSAGFTVPESVHPIVPVMIGDAAKTSEMARRMLEEGIFVVGFSYPVVPEGKARIRVQISAAHTKEDIDRVVEAFVRVGNPKHTVERP